MNEILPKTLSAQKTSGLFYRLVERIFDVDIQRKRFENDDLNLSGILLGSIIDLVLGYKHAEIAGGETDETLYGILKVVGQAFEILDIPPQAEK